MKREKLETKDLINVGVFTAIYLVVGIAWAAITGITPITYLALSVTAPIIGGIIIMLYMTKIKKPGMFFITALLGGLSLLATGMGIVPLICNVILGAIAELILRSGDYRSSKKSVLAYGVFSIATIGNYLPWAIAAQAQIESYGSRLGDEYAQTVYSYMSNSWIYVILAIASFASGILGGIIGLTLFKKHFKKAGIV